MAENYASYSQITMHRECPQKYGYRHIRGLERVDPEDVKVEMEMGLWWHALRAADAIRRGVAAGTLQWAPTAISTTDGGPSFLTVDEATGDTRTDLVDVVTEAARVYWDSLLPYVQEQWSSRIGGGLPDRLAEMDAAWWRRWGEDIEHEAPLAVELKWRRVLPTVRGAEGETIDADAAMSGYIDEVFLDRRRNVVVIRDHKSQKALAAASSANDLMDSQLHLYSWGAHEVVKAWGHGPIRAVAYDRIRMVAPKRPTLTATGTLSKSVTDYDLSTYLAWAAGPDGEGVPWGEPDTFYVSGKRKGEPKFGMYQAEDVVITRLSDPAAASVWTQRTMSPLNMNVIKAHLRAAVDTSTDITRTRLRFEVTGEAGRNMSRWCQWCPFVQLCRAEMIGGPDGEYDLEAMYLRQAPKRGRSTGASESPKLSLVR